MIRGSDYHKTFAPGRVLVVSNTAGCHTDIGEINPHTQAESDLPGPVLCYSSLKWQYLCGHALRASSRGSVFAPILCATKSSSSPATVPPGRRQGRPQPDDTETTVAGPRNSSVDIASGFTMSGCAGSSVCMSSSIRAPPSFLDARPGMGAGRGERRAYSIGSYQLYRVQKGGVDRVEKSVLFVSTMDATISCTHHLLGPESGPGCSSETPQIPRELVPSRHHFPFPDGVGGSFNPNHLHHEISLIHRPGPIHRLICR